MSAVHSVNNNDLLDQQSSDSLVVCRGYDGDVAEVPFLLVGLLGENVAVISVSSLDFTGSGERETLL